MTDYVFSVEPNGGHAYQKVQIKSDEPINIDLNQFYTVSRTYSDSIITDTFYTEQLLNEAEDISGYYKWYRISSHSRIIDKSPYIEKIRDEFSANLDYLSMMAGIEIPEKEVL